MSNRVDLIIVEIGDQRKVFMAPRHSCFEKGDEVVVETGIKAEGFELTAGKVIETLTFVDVDEHVVDFVLAAAKQTRPLPRIMQHVKYIDMEY